MRKVQPSDVPQWATDATYTSGIEAGQFTRLEPSLAIRKQGAIARTRLVAKIFNWLVGALSDHTDALADVYALNWPEFGTTETDGGFNLAANYNAPFASVLDSNLGGRPWLVACEPDGTIIRSADGARWSQAGSQPSGLTATILDIFGSGSLVLILEALGSGTQNHVWISFSAGNSWTGPSALPDPGSHPSYSLLGQCKDGAFVAAGGHIIASSPDGLTWTLRVWAAASFNSPTFMATARGYESGVGAIMGVATQVQYTLDGISWGAVTPTGSTTDLVAGCWSEAHQQWFVINGAGKLWSSSSVDGPWTLVSATINGNCAMAGFPGAAPSRCSMVSFGRNLVILSNGAYQIAGQRSGMIIVLDPRTGLANFVNPYMGRHGAFANTEQPWAKVQVHDGRLVVGRTRNTAGGVYQLELAMSLRAPWVQE